MGFLRKEWDFESPVEHDMENPVEEQKDRKLWLWGLALICGGLSVYSLYYIEKYIYGGAVETSWAGWLGTMTGTFIGMLIHAFGKPIKPVKDKWSRGEKIAGWCVLGIFMAAMALFIWKHQRMWLFGLQVFAVFPAAFALDKAQKMGVSKITVTAWDLILTFLLLAVVTFYGPKVLGVLTVEEAAEALTKAGYTEVKYKYDIDSYWIDHILPFAEVEENTSDWGDVYLFEIGESSGEAVVEPWSGTIIAE